MQLDILRVFTDEDGNKGNPLGVFRDKVPTERRQAIATDLGFSETVFIDDDATGELRIFTPSLELQLAGHPLVGTAWLLKADVLRPPAGEVPVRYDGDRVYITGRPEAGPPWVLHELADEAAVKAATPTDGDEYFWAWTGHDTVYSRSLITENGVTDEDEATGSAAMCLVAQVGRPVTVRQGSGSILYAEPAADGKATVGGRVVAHEQRDYPV